MRGCLFLFAQFLQTLYQFIQRPDPQFKLPHVFRHVRLKATLKFVHAKVFVLGRKISRDPVEITKLKALFVCLFDMMLVK